MVKDHIKKTEELRAIIDANPGHWVATVYFTSRGAVLFGRFDSDDEAYTALREYRSAKEYDIELVYVAYSELPPLQELMREVRMAEKSANIQKKIAESAERNADRLRLELYEEFVKDHTDFKKGSLWTPTRSKTPSPNMITNQVMCPIRFNGAGEAISICLQRDYKGFLALDTNTYWVALKHSDGTPALRPIMDGEVTL